MRVVIDTNVLRTTIKKGHFERFIYDAFKAEVFEWVVSTEILTVILISSKGLLFQNLKLLNQKNLKK